MEASSGPSINQTFGHTEVTNGSHSFQGVVKGDLHLHSNISDRQKSSLHIFDDLPQAAFNSARRYTPDCLPGTRKAVLEQISAWANGDRTPRVYWLEGMAGTGKSTIALTVARQQYENHRLGASFFFSRGGGGLASARYFPATIAAQLKEFSPELKKFIENAAAANPQIQNLMLYDQWKRLVIEPLSLMRAESFPHPLLIVIDALDECHDGESYGETAFSALLQCLKDVTTVENVEIRVFVSSRPEGAIKLGFESILSESFRGLILHNIEQTIVDEDLTLFYEAKLGEAAIELNQPSLRPSDEGIKYLVEKSHGLFIHAATICRFVRNGGAIAHQRMSSLLAAEQNSVKPEKELDKLYITVLESSLTENLEPEETLTEKRLFNRVMGSVVILFDVMKVPDLAMMLRESEDQVLGMLSRQRSVIDVPVSDEPIRLLHPSFRDFLLDSTRCLHPGFSIDPKEAHSHLFRCCLRIMKERLRRNMCRSSQLATNARHHISKSDMEMDIPIAVQYASCYWINHLRQSNIDPAQDPDVLEFFQYRFLYWLETLALVGRISDGVSMLRALGEIVTIPTIKPQRRRSWLTRKIFRKSVKLQNPSSNTPIPLHLVIGDAMRFLRSHLSVVESAPLQLYSSAIMFSPTCSITQQRYHREDSSWTLSKLGLSEEWGQHLQRLDCPIRVNDVAFSQDGGLIAVGLANGDVHLWEPVTGTEPKVLVAKRHIDPTADSHGLIELPDCPSWACRHRSGIVSVAFSPDGHFLATGTMGNGVSLWNLMTLTPLRSLDTPRQVTEVKFLPSGSLVASCFLEVSIWDVHTGAKMHTLNLDHSQSEISPMGLGTRRLASGYTSIASHIEPGKIEILDITTGKTRNLLQCNLSELPTGSNPFEYDEDCCNRPEPFEISPKGGLVAFELNHHTPACVVIDIATGKKNLWTEKTTSNIASSLPFAFSPKSDLIAVALGTRIEIFHTAMWKIIAYLESPQGSHDVTTISFSPNGELMITGSDSGLVCLWDITTFEDSYLSGSPTRGTSIRGTQGRACSKNGAIFLSPDDKIFFWDQKQQKARVMKGLGDIMGENVLSLDGKLAASGFPDRQISLYDTGTGALKRTLKWKPGGIWNHFPLVLSPNKKFLATVPGSGMFAIWDTTTGKSFHDGENGESEHDSCRTSKLVFSPDSRLIASGCYNGAIFIWEIEKDITNPKMQLNHDGDDITALAFSSDAKLLVSGAEKLSSSGMTRCLCLWDLTTGMQEWVSEVSSDSITAIAFSPNGDLMASTSSDGLVEIRDVKSGTVHQTLTTGVELKYLVFTSTGTDLLTDRGVISLSSNNSKQIFVSEDWIMLGGQPIVYLHPDWRDSLAFVSGDVIGFLDDSNEVQTWRYNRL